MRRILSFALAFYCGCMTYALAQSDKIAVIVVDGPFVLEDSHVVGYVKSRANGKAVFQPCRGPELEVDGALLISTELDCGDQPPRNPHPLEANCREFLRESIASANIDVRTAEIGSEFAIAPAAPGAVSVWTGGPERFLAAMQTGTCSNDTVNVNGAVGISIDVLKSFQNNYEK